MSITLYQKLGSNNLKLLVEIFYSHVFSDDDIKHLFTNDSAIIKEKQFLFLSQFLGGPQLYSDKHGHPKMKMRHLPHRIGQKEKDAWLRCMKTAINSLEIDEDLKISLYECFPRVAEHMTNQ